MKIHPLLFLFLIILPSCSKKQVWLTYKDSKHPFSIKYRTQTMQIKSSFNDLEERYRVRADIDLSDEFPHREVIYEDLFHFISEGNEKFAGFSKSVDEVSYEETDFNGLPAIASKDEKGRIRTYILLIPKVYAYVWLSGIDIRSNNPEDITQAESDRVEQLTYEMIKHFKWEQKIDTSSEDFKAWKKHIWEILAAPKKKQ